MSDKPSVKIGDRVRVRDGWGDPAVVLAFHRGIYAWIAYFDGDDEPETVSIDRLSPWDAPA